MSPSQRTFAAQLAQNPALAHSSILDEFSLPQATPRVMQATVRRYASMLGHIKDLLLELDALPLDFPNLSEVALLPSAVLRLNFLDLESETKFTVLLAGGKQYCLILSCLLLVPGQPQPSPLLRLGPFNIFTREVILQQDILMWRQRSYLSHLNIYMMERQPACQTSLDIVS